MATTTTVFVTGATGFIAQHIVIELLKNGYKVIEQFDLNPKEIH